jgi:hypothetical protein
MNLLHTAWDERIATIFLLSPDTRNGILYDAAVVHVEDSGIWLACFDDAAYRRHPVGLLCAACVMITPGHGRSRTNGDLSVPAGLQRPGQKGSSGPCPAHTPVATLLPGPESLAGGRPDLSASIPVKPAAAGI